MDGCSTTATVSIRPLIEFTSMKMFDTVLDVRI